MAWLDANFITLPDLYLAYRKAKVNMFYEPEHITAAAFCEYEENLGDNLVGLQRRLNASRPTWPKDSKFVGGYTYIPKALKAPPLRSQEPRVYDDTSFVNADPTAAWLASSDETKPVATFRLVGCHPVEYHVLSALWITKVGHKFDALLKEHAYGTRLRRKRVRGKHLGKVTELSMGSLEPYPRAFRTWRANGFTAIKIALKAEQSVVALTADIQSFYHRIDPSYLASALFAKAFKLSLTEDEQLFSRQFVQSLETWASGTPDHRSNPRRGIPVGLTAARIVANVALLGLDRIIVEELSPLYYGRYVDDIFLVLNNELGVKSVEDLWRFLSARSRGAIRPSEENRQEHILELQYAPGSELIFGADKQRVFALKGSAGEALLASIERTIKNLSSEWRMLPEMEPDSEALITDFITPGRDSSEEVDNLRKSDGATVGRLAFALCLRNLEATQHDLPPDQWTEERARFFREVEDLVVTPLGLFAYGKYFARLVGLAISARDWAAAQKVALKVLRVFSLVSQQTAHKKIQLTLCRHHVFEACYQAAAAALGPDVVVSDQARPAERVFTILSRGLPDARTLQMASDLGRRMFQRDLAREAFREHWLLSADDGPNRVSPDMSKGLPSAVAEELHVGSVAGFLRETKRNGNAAIPAAMVFPTRPYRIAEIVQLDQKCFGSRKRLARWAKALRGTEAVPDLSSESAVLTIPNTSYPHSPLVALPCLMTLDESWVASVTQEPDPDAGMRYKRINSLLNGILRSSEKIQYVVLPELSLPRKWFGRIAHKLAQSGISLIAGVEYEHYRDTDIPSEGASDAKRVNNQVWASLVTEARGFPEHVTYVQDKTMPAPKEELQLWGVGGCVLRAKNRKKPIIRHGLLQFGILICSELTNVKYRNDLRGNIDALFIPEWNKDTGSFSSLVEASALDIHCYIVQANNRAFGDCRIRGPYKEEFKRDVARIRGGEMDYFVTAKLDIDCLRVFQSHHRSPLDGEFKPVPDGFEIHPRRRVLPSKRKG